MTKKIIAKKYNSQEVEQNRYDWWVDNDYFFSEPDSQKPGFSIVLPPPNVTGKLHLGHAWDGSLQDTIIRYKKLQGFETLYLPGMDHAGIATQTKVEAKLKQQGISRFDLGREKFLEETWKWKDEYAATIRDQWKKLGLSLDYSKETFTLDHDVNELVNHVFVDLYNKGLIYKGKQIVNWDPLQKTAISNVEVIYKEVNGKMYYFKYFFENSDEYLLVATTRPETMFGDVALVVNPNDERYLQYLGKNVVNPANNKVIPIISDDYVEVDFGTGVMKVTPAHDPNDFAIGKRHNLAMPIALNEDGTVNELGGQYQGLDRFEARKQLVENSQANNTLEKVEDIVHQVGFSERSDAIVEPYLSLQWFVKMAPLATKVLELQKSTDKVDFFPARFNEVLETWMHNAYDWTISRQLWWGHRIPAWYHNQTGELYVNTIPPTDLENWTQDPDVLDTWFSSGLWPFATLKYTKETQKENKLFQKFYPNAVLVTGYDIIFFWVARMIFQSLEEVGTKPFNDVLIHGLVRDEHGVKMSKSLGNGIDPMDVIDQYGADSLRFFLLTNSTPGQDIKYSDAKLRDAWNFINKLWNASRFVQMNLDDNFVPWTDFEQKVIANQTSLSDINKWILSELTSVQSTVVGLLDKYEFGVIGRELYSFVWSKYCSWFIELSKVELNSENSEVKQWAQQTLFYVLKQILIILHPLIPFVTEQIYGSLNLKKSIMEEELVISEFSFETSYLEHVMEIIKELREFRLNNKVKKDVQLALTINKASQEVLADLESHQQQVNALLLSFVNSQITAFNQESDANVSSLPVNNFFVEVDNSQFFDKNKELEELKSKLVGLENELNRSQKMLNNQNFIQKADPQKVVAEQEKYANYQQQHELIKEKIIKLEK